jgi:hypothetical protein
MIRCFPLLACCVALAAVDGPGVPNRTYPANHINRIIGHCHVPDAGKTRFMAMHNGYLVFNSGRGVAKRFTQRGCLSVFDIRDPYNPALKFRTTGFSHMANGWGVSGNLAAIAGFQSGTLRLMDLTDPTAPQPVTTITLPFSIGTPGTAFIQWPYLYVGGHAYGTGDGETVELMIYDIGTPTAPVLKRIMKRKEIGFRGVNICICGNLMSVVAGGNADGGAFYDISDPVDPKLLSRPTIQRSYGGWMCGDLFFSGYQIHDISDPTKPKLLSNANDNGYYPQFQQRICYTKAFDRHSKRALRWVDMDSLHHQRFRQRHLERQRRVPLRLAVLYRRRHDQRTDPEPDQYRRVGQGRRDDPRQHAARLGARHDGGDTAAGRVLPAPHHHRRKFGPHRRLHRHRAALGAGGTPRRTLHRQRIRRWRDLDADQQRAHTRHARDRADRPVRH